MPEISRIRAHDKLSIPSETPNPNGGSTQPHCSSVVSHPPLPQPTFLSFHPISLLLSPHLPHPLTTSGLIVCSTCALASLEDTRRSYAHTRAHTPCTSQISTLREHTNKPPSHVCTYSIQPALYVPTSTPSPSSSHPSRWFPKSRPTLSSSPSNGFLSISNFRVQRRL